MAVRKSQQKAVAKYVKANYDRIEFKTKKEELTKEDVQAHVKQHGYESLNKFCTHAIKETMKRDNEASK